MEPKTNYRYYGDENVIEHAAKPMGTWTCFYEKKKDEVENLCETAIDQGLCALIKLTYPKPGDKTGFLHFYAIEDDIFTNKDIIRFMIDNHLLRKSTRLGHYPNLAFEIKSNQTLRLSDIMDLKTGQWVK